MMLTDVLRFLRGYVGFSVDGRYPERFMNITARNGVRLWNVRRRGEGFTARMYRADYRRIRPLARKAGVRLSVKHRGGLPAFLHRYRNRAGLVLGGCAFLLSVFVMSLFVWNVDITGLKTVSQSRMKDLLREHGLYVGAFRPALDPQQISRDILLERHEIGWMAVNLSGSCASVEVKEEAPAPPVTDTTVPCNIKARSDGVILRIEASEGTTVIKEGSGVIAGQLIVSGVRGDEENGYRLVHADARVLARTTRQASFSTAQRSAVLMPVGEQVTRRSLMLFGLRLPYRFGNVASPLSVSRTWTESPAPLGVTLPLGITTERVSAMESAEEVLGDNSAKELLMREAALYEVFSLSACTVEKRESEMTRQNGVYTLRVTYTCVEDIADPVPIGVEE